MPKLTYNCPQCGKQLRLTKEYAVENTKVFEYACGHIFSRDIAHIDRAQIDFTSCDGSGKQAREYQKSGVEFILESDFNAIIADQMRLGKTPQSLLAFKNKLKDRAPCLILVKSANLWQWVREFKTWVTTLPNGIFPVVGSNAWIPPGFSAYIISMDTFSREKIQAALRKIPFKLIIADEAHSYKNTSSNRSQMLVDFITFLNTGESDTTLEFTCNRCAHKFSETAKVKYDKRIGHTILSKSTKCPKCGQYCYQQQQHNEREKWQGNPEAREKITKLLALAAPSSNTSLPERVAAYQKAEELKQQYNVKDAPTSKPCGLILLTGTPILNRAEEYFVPLNLVNPERFNSIERFRREWLEQDSKGKWSRVKSYYVDSFKQTIAPYILRREKEDVYKDLPAINRMYTFIEPDKETYAKEYNRILDKMEVKLAEKANPSYWDMADDLMQLRRICGMMKLMWTADYLESCALESNAKYAIGIHHETVRDVLYIKLGGEKNCYKLSGEDSSERKDFIMRDWEHSSKQFLIINMIAGGVGMDFHYCDNLLTLERQWNLETERQFEFRFYNPDKSIKANNLNSEYIIAKSTFEEWWHTMLIEKAGNVDPLVYNNPEPISGTSFRDLMEQTVGARL